MNIEKSQITIKCDKENGIVIECISCTLLKCQ